MDIYWSVLSILLVHTGLSVAECPNGWVVYEGSCYLFSHEPKTFTDAENYCIQRGAHLVNIGNKNENLFVKSFCRELKVHNYWIGLTDTEIEGIWKWKDTGQEATFKDFHPSEPNSGNLQNCGVLWSPFDFNWGDYPCNGICMPLCEKSALYDQELVIG